MVSTAASVHIGGGDFMPTAPKDTNKPIEASLLATTKSALDELVWSAHATMATMAAKAAEAS